MTKITEVEVRTYIKIKTFFPTLRLKDNTIYVK